MKSGLKDYACEWESELNIPLMEKEADDDLVECIVDTWRSLEVLPQIKFKGYEFDPNPSHVEINSYIYKREKRKRKKEKYDIKLKSDDLVGKLTVYLEATVIEEDPKTKERKIAVYPLKKVMLIPLQDENGYFHLKGKRFMLIYQLVEKSTYSSHSSITLKSLMPIALKRHSIDVTDIHDKSYTLPYYRVFVFRKEIDTILFYLAQGLDWCLDYLNVSEIISFIPTMEEEDEDFLYFPMSSKCILKVMKAPFMKYQYVQSIVGAFAEVCTNRITIAQLDDTKQWIKRIANPQNYEKGAGILRFFNRLLDKNTQKDLRLPEYHKKNIYALIRWMMEHYAELRLKDNCSLGEKRLRCNECISSLMDKEFSKRLNRVISHGDKVTIDNIKEIFKFSGEILIQKMHSSGLLRYDDCVNDMSMWSTLKYTSKGVHSLGSGNSNSIGIKYRSIHPSHLGYLDILVCGNSDPGTSGVISPFAKIDGLYFDGSDEKCDFYYNLVQDLKEYYAKSGKHCIGFTFDNERDFYDTLYMLDKVVDDEFKFYGTSREGQLEMIIEDGIDIDENTKQVSNHSKEDDDESSDDAGELSEYDDEPDKKTDNGKDED